MNRTLVRSWPLLLALVGVGGFVYAGWRLSTAPGPGDGADQGVMDYEDVEPDVDPGPDEVWDTVDTTEVDEYQEFPGSVKAEGSVEVRAPEGMRAPVLEIHKEVGEYVNEGDPLITFFVERYEEARDEARAAGDDAKADELQRYVDSAVIRAPNDGQVLQLHTSEGEVSYDIGKPLLTLTNKESWSFLVTVPGYLVTEVAPLGARLTVEFDDLGEVQGTVTAHDNDPRSGPTTAVDGDTVLLIIGLDPTEGLEPFTTGVVRLPTGKKEVMLIPPSAVDWRGEVPVVRVWDDDLGGISEQTVQTRREELGGKLVVLYGLFPKQPILVPGRRD